MKINFNKVSDEENSFELLPEGIYDDAVIASVTEGKTKDGLSDIWKIKIETSEGNVFDQLVLNDKAFNQTRIKKYYALAGFDFESMDEEYELDLDDLVGAKLNVAVKIEPYNGKDYNKVDLFRCEPAAPAIEEKPAAAAKAAPAAAKKARPFG